ncbi:MAG: DNA repair protein RecN [Ruminococcaceae bacterium]|nr:DNA repair protein RecN [Oscillospiraceae bacterium]
MLRSLYIENIAIIEKASLDFERGFTVLSGETGAGKSIIIDAINGIMGGRTSRELIRTNAKKAVVIAEFEDMSPDVIQKLNEHSIELSDGKLIIQRDMLADGKNNCKINGRPCTTQSLKDISKYLITIHGQHDGGMLLDEETHIDYLDSFARNTEIFDTYTKEYEELLRQNRRIKGLSMSIRQREERIERLNKDIEYLEKLGPKKGEYEDLTNLRKLMMGISSVNDAVVYLENSLENDDGGIMAILYTAQEKLKKAEKYNGDIAKAIEKLTEAISALEDARGYSDDVRNALDSYSMSYEEVEERLELYEKAAKKFTTSETELYLIKDNLQNELESLIYDSNEDIDALKEKYVLQRNITLQAAQNLRKSREDASKILKSTIENELAYLDMQNARIEVEMLNSGEGEQIKFTKKGIDSVRFLLSANKGEGFKALSKIASGGELSRIMLAIKNVLSKNELVETMIFDEVDTGVSGRAANKVGEKLWNIAREKQVLCITHLPQIAVFADSHYMVAKETANDVTLTHAEKLGSEGKIREIARLTGGRDITNTTMESAKEMIALANSYKDLNLC